MAKRWHPLTILFLGLALIGLLHQLLTNPVQLLSSILLIGLVIFVFVLLYRHFIGKPYPKIKQPQRKKRSKRKRMLSKRRKPPFKVIDGHKGKNKGPYSS